MEYNDDSGNRPTIMVTNDNGIDAPGLQALVSVLVSTNSYQVQGAPVEEEEITDYHSLQEGYITVTPLGALSHAEIECQAYFKEWLPDVVERSSSAL